MTLWGSGHWGPHKQHLASHWGGQGRVLYPIYSNSGGAASEESGHWPYGEDFCCCFEDASILVFPFV